MQLPVPFFIHVYISLAIEHLFSASSSPKISLKILIALIIASEETHKTQKAQKAQKAEKVKEAEKAEEAEETGGRGGGVEAR